MSVKTKEESNPFFHAEEEEDDFSTAGHYNDQRENLKQIKHKIAMSEQRQLDSLRSTNVMVQESTQVGLQTAEKLVRQEEQLKKTEENLDSIHAMTTVTQRHINGIKSVFGSLKNRMFGRSEAPPTNTKVDIPHSRLQETLDEEYRNRSSPDVSRRYQKGAQRLVEDSDSEEDSGLRDISQSSSRQAMFDEQLGEISTGIHTLKSLGLGMQDHLKQEEQLLERLNEKTERNDAVISKQNKQMKSLLRN